MIVHRNNLVSVQEHFDIIQLGITLELNARSGKISPFESGHMDIVMGNACITSRNKNPDQSFMVLSSMVDLFAGLSRLRLEKRSSSYFFVGDDSSFAIIFRLLPGKILHVRYSDIILEMPFNRFAEELMKETRRILNEYAGRLGDTNGVILDLVNAMDKLNVMLRQQSQR